MSRVADTQYPLASGIQFACEKGQITLSNGKESLSICVHPGVEVTEQKEITEEGGERRFLACSYDKTHADQNMQAGTTMAHIRNALVGLTDGFTVKMIIKGTGYKVKMAGKQVEVNSGKSHLDFYAIPEKLDVTSPDASTLIVKGASKQMVGDFVDRVRKGRDARKDPYKLRGWQIEKPWKVEIIRRKEQVKK